MTPAAADVPASVGDAVRAAGLGGVERAVRAGAGQRNDVWMVRTSEGADVVVRLLHDDSRLAMECAVIAAAAREGVTVAEVLWAASEPVAVMVQQRLPGRRLADVESTDVLCASVASTLRAIHSIPAAGGFGTLRADLRGATPELATWFVDVVRREVEASADAGRLDHDDRALLDGSLAVLEAARPLLARQPSGLAHGDLQPHNILVEGDAVSGVLDWEAAKAGPVAFDFGWWDWFSAAWRTPWPTARMLHHYDPERRLDREQLDAMRSLVVRRVWTRELPAALAAGDQRRAVAARAALA